MLSEVWTRAATDSEICSFDIVLRTTDLEPVGVFWCGFCFILISAITIAQLQLMQTLQAPRLFAIEILLQNKDSRVETEGILLLYFLKRKLTLDVRQPPSKVFTYDQFLILNCNMHAKVRWHSWGGTSFAFG